MQLGLGEAVQVAQESWQRHSEPSCHPAGSGCSSLCSIWGLTGLEHIRIRAQRIRRQFSHPSYIYIDSFKYQLAAFQGSFFTRQGIYRMSNDQTNFHILPTIKFMAPKYVCSIKQFLAMAHVRYEASKRCTRMHPMAQPSVPQPPRKAWLHPKDTTETLLPPAEAQ